MDQLDLLNRSDLLHQMVRSVLVLLTPHLLDLARQSDLLGQRNQ